VCTLHWRFVRYDQLVTRSSLEFLCSCRRNTNGFFPAPYGRTGSPSCRGGHRIRHSWTHASFSGVPCPALLRVGWVLCQRDHFRFRFITILHPCSISVSGAAVRIHCQLTACEFLRRCFKKTRTGPEFTRETGPNPFRVGFLTVIIRNSHPSP
jgi:hypothetical protein